MRSGIDVTETCRGQLSGDVVNIGRITNLRSRHAGLVVDEHAGVVFAPLGDRQNIRLDGQNRRGPHGPVPPEQVPSLVERSSPGGVGSGHAINLQFAGCRSTAKPALGGFIGFGGICEVVRQSSQGEIRPVRI
ncbi:hypothetical protein D9M71_705550 [compost metagenome]